MIPTHSRFRAFKQVVEAGIVCSDDERFVVGQAKFLRLIGATEAEWEEIRQLNSTEKEYGFEKQGEDFIFSRFPAVEAF